MDAALIKPLVALFTPLFTKGVKSGSDTIISELQKTHYPKIQSSIVERIKTIGKARTIWTKGTEIEIEKIYYKTTIGQEKIEATSVTDMPDRLTVIEGIVGHGKSFLLRYLTVRAIKEEKAIPIFVELRTVKSNSTLIDTFQEYLGITEAKNPKALLDHILNSGKAVLLLDGFDEVADSNIANITSEITEIAGKYKDLQIIITSRPGREVQKAPNFTTTRIGEFTQEDTCPFLRKITDSFDLSNKISETLANSNRDIINLANTPLMLTLIALVYKTENEIPETVPLFFEKLFHVVFTGHDKQKLLLSREFRTDIGEHALQELFEAFCFQAMLLKNSRTLTPIEFTTAFQKASKLHPEIKCNADNFKEDITKVTCLMQEENINDLTFIHKSIIEYFTAAYIKKLQDEKIKKFYTHTSQDYIKWQPVIDFLKEIDNERYQIYYIKHFSEVESNAINDALSKKDPLEYIKSELSNTKIKVYLDIKSNIISNISISSPPAKNSISEEIKNRLHELAHNAVNNSISEKRKNLISNMKEFDKNNVNSGDQSLLKAVDFFKIFDYLKLEYTLGEISRNLNINIDTANAIISRQETLGEIFN